MIRKSMLVAVMLLMYFSAVQAESSDSSKKNLYFKLGGDVQNGVVSKTEHYLVVLGKEYDDHVVTKNVSFSDKLELYYKSEKIIGDNETTKTNIAGLSLGRLKCIKYVKDDMGPVPYLNFSFEYIDTEKVTGLLVENKTDRVVAWTLGVETKLNSRFSLDVYHVWKLGHFFSNEVANETGVSFIYTFPI